MELVTTQIDKRKTKLDTKKKCMEHTNTLMLEYHIKRIINILLKGNKKQEKEWRENSQ